MLKICIKTLLSMISGGVLLYVLWVVGFDLEDKLTPALMLGSLLIPLYLSAISVYFFIYSLGKKVFNEEALLLCGIYSL